MRQKERRKRVFLIIASVSLATLSSCATSPETQQQSDLSAILDDVRRSSAAAWDVDVPGIGAAVAFGTDDVVSAVS